jgi:Cyclic nucleotide-binding domain
MGASAVENNFIVWGLDHAAYGPVELPTLVSWVQDDRVTAETWLFANKTGNWLKATDMPELQMFFRKKSRQAAPDASASPRGFQPDALRRIKILAPLTPEQIERFAQYTEVEQIPQFSVVVHQGEPGNSMYFILQGELRVRMNVMGKETILTTLGPGEFFGDISLFDHGPRSADVVANVDSVVVKLSASAVDTLSKEAPDLAATFLRAMGHTLSARIRADNKRYGDSVKFRGAID